MWILMHKNNPTHFRLLLSLFVFQLDHKSLTLWCQPSPKKSYLIYIAWNYHSTWIFAQKKSIFFPLNFGPSMLHALEISGLEIPDHRMADAFPTFFSQGFTLIILGVSHTNFMNRYPVPGADERTATHRAERGCFSKYSLICLILVL